MCIHKFYWSIRRAAQLIYLFANVGARRAAVWMLCLCCLSLNLRVNAFADSAKEQISTSHPNRPNVVLIFMDDLGYGDVRPFGDIPYSTPNLDRLAAEGRCFTDFQVSSAVCSASRAALMTGCYHQRVGITGALGPSSRIGIHANEKTIAEVCREQGYATACYGKWHLGHHEPFLPHHHGFDHFFGLPYSNDMWPLHPENVAKQKKNPTRPSDWPPLPLIEAYRGSPATVLNRDVQPSDQEQLTSQYTRKSVQFIRDHKDKPFFLYLAHSMVHVPLYVSSQFSGKSGVGLFGDVMMEVDWSVGQIMQTIAECEIEEETIIIFTSDNGPWLSYGNHAGNAGSLREGKGTMFEGGCRVPMIMRWKGQRANGKGIVAGSHCDKLCSTIDVLPTISSLIGGRLPDHEIDGVDISDIIFGHNDAASPREHFAGYYESNHLHTIRNERWKLHLSHPYRTLNGRPGGTDGVPVSYENRMIEGALYDLDADVSERVDVSKENPQIVAQLMSVAEEVQSELGMRQPNTPGKGVRPPGRLP